MEKSSAISKRCGQKSEHQINPHKDAAKGQRCGRVRIGPQFPVVRSIQVSMMSDVRFPINGVGNQQHDSNDSPDDHVGRTRKSRDRLMSSLVEQTGQIEQKVAAQQYQNCSHSRMSRREAGGQSGDSEQSQQVEDLSSQKSDRQRQM